MDNPHAHEGRFARMHARSGTSEEDGTQQGDLVFCVVLMAGMVFAVFVFPPALTSFFVWFALIGVAISAAVGTQRLVQSWSSSQEDAREMTGGDETRSRQAFGDMHSARYAGHAGFKLMLRASLVSAALTGLFCAGFAIFVDAITMLISVWHLLAVSFVSGFLGSLFATFITSRLRP